MSTAALQSMFLRDPNGRQAEKYTFTVCLSVVLLCGVMALADGVFSLPYIPKSATKILSFAVAPLLIGAAWRDISPLSVFMMPAKDKKSRRAVFAFAACGGILLVGLIVGGYFLLRGIIDFSAVTDNLAGGEGVTRENFPLVAAYITICNSFLEEFFFRGFAFLNLRRFAGRKFACIFSAAAFSVYHAAILDGWFSPLMLVLLLAGLFAGGLIFNILADKGDSIVPSWLLHMAANLGINIIGFILFGIL